MTGLSRIHFGNGDIYDGETVGGKMQGKGFFYDCENKAWVFGLFSDDNCEQVLENATGFPDTQMQNFRLYFHQNSENFIRRATSRVDVDLQTLITWAQKDVSEVVWRQEASESRVNVQAIEKTKEKKKIKVVAQDQDNLDDEDVRKQKLHEFYKEALKNQELLREEKSDSKPKKLPRARKPWMEASDTSNDLRSRNEYQEESYHERMPKRGAELAKKISPKAIQRSFVEKHSIGKNGDILYSQPERYQKSSASMTEEDVYIVGGPKVAGVHMGRQPNSMDIQNKKRRTKKSDHPQGKASGNQVMQHVNVIKPRNILHTEPQEKFLDLQQQLSDKQIRQKSFPENKLKDFSMVSSVKERDESRDLRNISIQTEDKIEKDNEGNLSLSYLKGIHNMIDELKQMVSEKITSNKDRSEILAELNQPELNFRRPKEALGALVSPGSHIDQETQQDLWNQQIDQQLEEKRQAEIMAALNGFNGSRVIEVDENNLDEELEPIQESYDEEEEVLNFVEGRDRSPDLPPLSSDFRLEADSFKKNSGRRERRDPGRFGEELAREFTNCPQFDQQLDECLFGVDGIETIPKAEEASELAPKKLSFRIYTDSHNQQVLNDQELAPAEGLQEEPPARYDIRIPYPLPSSTSQNSLRQPLQHTDRNSETDFTASEFGSGHLKDNKRFLQIVDSYERLNPASQTEVPEAECDHRYSNFMESRKGQSVSASNSQLPAQANPESLDLGLVYMPVEERYSLNPYLYKVEVEDERHY